MATQYKCKDQGRRMLVRASMGGASPVNGIDYVEVSPKARTIAVHFVNDLAVTLDESNIEVAGKARAEYTLMKPVGNPMMLTLTSSLEYNAYRLRLVRSPDDDEPPGGFDRRLCEIEFSFMVNCFNEFDCRQEAACPAERPEEPQIDYMAKDYASFRRLMLDRLSLVSPGWKERSPADLGMALVELVAYEADHLSYYQDAVATEAYLGTARKRASVRRHARLLDYRMHDGCNARAWVQVRVSHPITVYKGTAFLTRFIDGNPTIEYGSELYGQAMVRRAEVFETMDDEVTLYPAHNEISFYTWGDGRCCLPKGATGATLVDDGLENLQPGDVLILKEARSPVTGREEDADMSRRHAVRLTGVRFITDTLPKEAVRLAEVKWHPEDALPFHLCLWDVAEEGSADKKPASIALGNIVLADHGQTIKESFTVDGSDTISLSDNPVTQQGHVLDGNGESVPVDIEKPASVAMSWALKDVRPSAGAVGDSDKWAPQWDLLSSDRFDPHFVLETEEDGRAYIRFGDNVLGRRPREGSRMDVTYRVGNGRAGNVGPGAISHLVANDGRVTGITNPMAAAGGLDPEPVEEVRLNSPWAFRVQERAVTEEDYASVAMRHPDIQKAVATLRWTGSWHTMFITVDRRGGRAVDREFKEELLNFIERFRMAGHDLEINSPSFVPLDIGLTVCVRQGYVRSDIKKELIGVFSNKDRPDGTRGFFHPDNFTFGQPVYLGQVIAAAMRVPGVAWVTGDRFRRWLQPDQGEMKNGCIRMERLEIARADNDPDNPQNGKIDINVVGGL